MVDPFIMQEVSKCIVISFVLFLVACGSALDGKYPNPMVIEGQTYTIEKGKFKGQEYLSPCYTDDFVFQVKNTSQFIEVDVDLSQCDFWGANLGGYGLHLIFFDRITQQYWYGLNFSGAVGNNHYWISEIQKP